MNIALAAEEWAGLQILQTLTRSHHRLVAVLSSPSNDESGTSVWSVARSLGFATWPAKLVKDPDFADRLRLEQIDIFLNVHSLYIIAAAVLAVPRLGAFNLHPGPLPRYAGLNAISWAIYHGEKTHGVTIHKMEPGIDTGPIAYQSFFPVEDSDSALSLSFKCVREGGGLMLKLLEDASAEPGRLVLVPQNLSQREYFGRAVPNEGVLSWCWPASRIINFVRACDYFPFRSPWGSPRTQLGERTIEVVKASRTGLLCDTLPGTVGSPLGSGVQVASLDEWVLVNQLKIGDKLVKAIDILKSHDRFEANNYVPRSQ
jgi:methionyl-tRNA formyltransferase